MKAPVSVDPARIRAVGEFLSSLPACSPSDWTFEGLPTVGEAHVVDYFFMSVKHQYGFWRDDGRTYTGPMYAEVDGKRLKGSDFVWTSLARSLRREPALYNIERQSAMSDAEVAAVFSDDAGICPLPMLESHADLWRAYARDMLRQGHTPGSLVGICRSSTDAVGTLMGILKGIGGYGEDPLAKKAALLAVILANRPERFLGKGPFQFPPIVDYHIQRSALRIGLVRIQDPDLESRIRRRAVLSGDEEDAIRREVYAAMLDLEARSGKGIDSLDWFFFQNRRRCPEMSDPDCPACEIEGVCAKRKDLFQPVLRTTFY